jgi:uncharacterized protein involved in exopolysaccharide biosynthesis
LKETSNVTPIRPAQATAREFFTVLFRRKWMILGLFLVTTITVIVLSMVQTESYVSSGRVLIRRGESESSLVPYRRSFGNWEEELGSELELIKSYPVLQLAREILKRETPNGQTPPPLEVTQVAVQVLGKSNAVLIGYEDRDPEVAQRACDAMIRAYIEYRQSVTTIPYPKQFFEREIGEIETDLNRKVEMRRSFSNRSGVVDLADQRRNILAVLSVLQQRRTDTGAQLADLRAMQRVMRELSEKPGVDMPVQSAGVANEPAIGDLKQRVVEHETRIAVLRERYLDGSTEITNAQATLDTLRSMLRREVTAWFAVSQSGIERLEAKLADIEREIAGLDAELAEMPNKETTLTELDQEIELLRNRFTDITEKADLARVTENTMVTVTVLLLDPAEPATLKSRRDYVRMALAPAFSLVIGIGLAFFLDGLDLTVRTAGQAEQALDLPVLASLNEQRRRRSSMGEPPGP